MSFSFHHLLLHNFRYKVLATFLASILWYLVQGEEILEINRKIRVHLDPPSEFVIKGGPIRFKDATLSGPRALLSVFSSDYIDAHIPISIDHPAILRFRIDKEFIKSWNNRIKLTVHDAYLSVDVDTKSQKTLPLVENLQGLPKEGFIVEKTIIQPNKIGVIGAKIEIGELNQVFTEAIDISGLSQTKTFDVGLLTTNLDVQYLSDKAKVTVQIGEKKFNKSFSHIPIQAINSELATQITPQTISITIQASHENLALIKETDFVATMDLKDMPPGIYEKKPQIKIPEQVFLVESSPESVIIEILSKKKK